MVYDMEMEGLINNNRINLACRYEFESLHLQCHHTKTKTAGVSIKNCIFWGLPFVGPA